MTHPKHSLYCKVWRLRNIDRIRISERERQRKWRKDNPELAKQKDKEKHIRHKDKRNAYGKEYYEKHRDELCFKKQRNERSLRYYYQNKVKALARNTLNKAIKRGLLSKNDFCCICGSDKYIQAHHDDYNKPLDVRWVCRKCHYKLSNQALQDIADLFK